MAMTKRFPKSTEDEIGNFVCENYKLSYEKLVPVINEQFGVDIGINWLKRKAQENGWGIRRKQKQGEASQKEETKFDPNNMVAHIAQILYQSIVADWNEAQELNPSKVNAFMNLLDKADIKVTQTTSGKTPQQQIIDLVAKIQAQGG